MTGAHDRGREHCALDRCENAPFSSVGGLDARSNMVAPHYIAEADREEYLRGYRDEARSQYGEDWETCAFEWRAAITIESEPLPPRLFRLVRNADVTGVSGTGHVADGVMFDDGAVVVHWRGEHRTTTVHPSIASVEAVHLHGGATVIEWATTSEQSGTRVDFFQASGKWYTTEYLRLKDGNPWGPVTSLENACREQLQGRLQGMHAVCIDGPWGFPVMARVPRSGE